MKKGIVLIASVLLVVFSAFSQSGVWSGDIEVQGVSIPLVFHLSEENPVIDSPAQGVKGLPIQIVKNDSDSLAVNIPLIGATFKGRVEDKMISGIFSQRGYELPLVLTPGDHVVKRPQTPKPPFPYSQEEVSFTNGDAVLKGTLTLPSGYDSRTPVLIMITGSGLQNRDEELFDHKPFAVIADALAKAGIATLRYDDRGFGESTGDVVNCTTEDLMNDALSGINLLRQRFDHVGVLGHSEGGTISFMLGADHKVDFIVSLAGMVISGKETLMQQNKYMLTQGGYSPEIVEEYCMLISRAFDGEEGVADMVNNSNLPIELKQNLLPALPQLKTPYMQYFLTTDVRNILSEVKCPVLAVNGTKDTQVVYLPNLEALKDGLPTGDKNCIKAMDGLNHAFQHCTTGAVSEYATIEETISPDLLKLIAEWVNSLYES